MESSADLSLIVVGNLLLEDLESLVDVTFNGGLGSGEDPHVLGLGKEEGIARVDEGEVLVVGGEDAVVTGGSIGEELDLALSTVEGSDGVGSANNLLNWVELAVEDSDGAVGVGTVTSLLAVVGFPRHGGISGLLVPETQVSLGIEVGLEGRGGAGGANSNASIDNADEGEGSEDNSLEHRNFLYVFK